MTDAPPQERSLAERQRAHFIESPAGLQAGLQAQAAYGMPPTTLRDRSNWIQRHFSIIVGIHRSLPEDIYGVYYPDISPLYQGNVEYLRRSLGVPCPAIFVAQASPWPRYTILHELAHHLTPCLGAYRAEDGNYYSRDSDEQAANSCAVILAIDPSALTQRLHAGQSILQIARSFGVPAVALALRLRLLSAIPNETASR